MSDGQKVTRKPPGTRTLPLKSIHALEIETPAGAGISDNPESVNLTRALALYSSLEWSTDDLWTDPLRIADDLECLADLLAVLPEIPVMVDEKDAPRLGNPEQAQRLLTRLIRFLVAFLRVAGRSDDELAARFRIEVSEEPR